MLASMSISTPETVDARPTAGTSRSGHRPPPTPRSRTVCARIPRGAIVPLQLFVATGWLRAAIEKIIDPAWWSGDTLSAFLSEQRVEMLPWFRWFSDATIEPIAPVVAGIVLITQLAIAGCLLGNRWVTRALWAGIVLNLCFTMAGRVNPSAFYLVMQTALLFALSRRVSETVAVRRAILWLVPAALVVPFARTLHPHEVIEDPALMLSFIGVTASVTTIVMSFPPERILELVDDTKLGRTAPGRMAIQRLRPARDDR